jgi:hypothetical protein
MHSGGGLEVTPIPTRAPISFHTLEARVEADVDKERETIDEALRNATSKEYQNPDGLGCWA